MLLRVYVVVPPCSCPPGQMGLLEGQGFCSPCLRDTYRDHAMPASACTRCSSISQNLVTLGEGAADVTECVCRAGFYANGTVDARAESGAVCVACDDKEVNCSAPGSTLESLVVQSNVWRASPLSTAFQPCRLEGVCIGGSGQSVCREHHTGPLCEVSWPRVLVSWCSESASPLKPCVVLSLSLGVLLAPRCVSRALRWRMAPALSAPTLAFLCA
jgi:hypothetical protein